MPTWVLPYYILLWFLFVDCCEKYSQDNHNNIVLALYRHHILQLHLPAIPALYSSRYRLNLNKTRNLLWLLLAPYFSLLTTLCFLGVLTENAYHFELTPLQLQQKNRLRHRLLILLQNVDMSDF